MKRIVIGSRARDRWSPGRRRRSLGFCGFYVAKADTKLFNKASQVVLVRDGDRTVLTMANDFKGEPKEFAVVDSGADVPASASRSTSATRRSSITSTPIRRRAWSSTSTQNPCRRCGESYRWRPAAPRRAMHDGQAGRRTGEEPRRHDRGAVHGRRVRHPDPVGATELRARDLAAGERLSDSGRRLGGARQLPETEHAVLRREGEPDGAGEARVLVPAAAAGRLRIAEVHAADPARHGQRRRRRRSCSSTR